MPATSMRDINFVPKVWSDHSMAYAEKRLVYGAFALVNNELKAQGTGTVVNFPYYNYIGPAQEIAENESSVVDNLTDDSFLATVKEIVKTVGFKKAAMYKSADTAANMMKEAQRQIGRVIAEKVDLDLNNDITTYDSVAGGALGTDKTKYNNLDVSFVASSASQVMNVRTLHIAKVLAFRDKSDQGTVCFMHPLQYLDSRIDVQSGFLKADANSPYSAINGFMGMLANMAIVLSDSVKKLPTQIDGKDAYLAHFHKVNAYGIIRKQELEFDEDKDVKARQWEVTANHWYGTRSFHKQINPDDRKSGGMITTVSESYPA